MKNTFTKITRPIALLVWIIFVIFVLNRVFTPKYITENKDGRITEEFYLERTNPDVLYLGSSTMYNGVSPVCIWNNCGITGFVRSNASQTLWQSYYLLKEALTMTKPSLVVLDMSFIKYGEEFVEEPSNRKALEKMRHPLYKYQAAQASMYEEEDVVSYFLPVLRYHSRWRELTGEDVKYAFNPPLVSHSGFLMEFGTPEEQKVYERTSIDCFEFPPKAIEYLDKIIALCHKNNIPLFLVKTPTFSPNWHDEYDEWIAEKAEADGISYCNFDSYIEDMGIELTEDYVDDGNHLNVGGAEKFSVFLGDYIKKRYGVLNSLTHDEATEREWAKKTERYEKDKAAGVK